MPAIKGGISEIGSVNGDFADLEFDQLYAYATAAEKLGLVLQRVESLNKSNQDERRF